MSIIHECGNEEEAIKSLVLSICNDISSSIISIQKTITEWCQLLINYSTSGGYNLSVYGLTRVAEILKILPKDCHIENLEIMAIEHRDNFLKKQSEYKNTNDYFYSLCPPPNIEETVFSRQNSNLNKNLALNNQNISDNKIIPENSLQNTSNTILDPNELKNIENKTENCINDEETSSSHSNDISISLSQLGEGDDFDDISSDDISISLSQLGEGDDCDDISSDEMASEKSNDADEDFIFNNNDEEFLNTNINTFESLQNSIPVDISLSLSLNLAQINK